MALQLIEPHDRYMLKRDVIDRRAVIGHLRSVLNVFANKPEFGKFYVGITGDVEARLLKHRRYKPEFRLLVPIYEEQEILHEDSFDGLEKIAIREFRDGIRHPTTGDLLIRCDNGPGGAAPKRTLYILVG
jgi:hypothetical protein